MKTTFVIRRNWHTYSSIALLLFNPGEGNDIRYALQSKHVELVMLCSHVYLDIETMWKSVVFGNMIVFISFYQALT